ncbi:MAG TPA: DUF2300 domain-containing protein [Bordetella sp.]
MPLWARNTVQGRTRSTETARRLARGLFRLLVLGLAAGVGASPSAASPSGAVHAVPPAAGQGQGRPDSALRFAWLRAGDARLWTLDPIDGQDSPDAGQPLPDTLRTPLGSVWKLFVYAYLIDRQIPAPDYACDGGNRDEVYCCTAGGSIDRDHALVQSCGLFFEPGRLALDPQAWRRYWRALDAPAWLEDLGALGPQRRVAVADLLKALARIPSRARDETAATLVSVVTVGRGQNTVSRYGSLLRVKTWTMPDPADDKAYVGGAAGWLADGTPVWLGGRGGSRQVLVQAAQPLAPWVAASAVPDDHACVAVDFFSRYSIREVDGPEPDRRPAPAGLLDGAWRVHFQNGNAISVIGHGDLLLDRPADGAPRIVGRFGMNDYVARVVEREGSAVQPQAARALAVAVRSYLVQNAGRERGCYRIDDSSRTQRVLPRPASRAARAAADFTDGLVLVGTPVRFHLNQAAPGQMSWQAAQADARSGLGFDAILARTWPQADLAYFTSPLAGDCLPLLRAQDWLRLEAPRWEARLAGEAGYELPDQPAVCELNSGRPYADARRNRIYIQRLVSDEDRITLAHEYLHLAFAHHPRGLDEQFIERTARKLIYTGDNQ